MCCGEFCYGCGMVVWCLLPSITMLWHCHHHHISITTHHSLPRKLEDQFARLKSLGLTTQLFDDSRDFGQFLHVSKRAHFPRLQLPRCSCIVQVTTFMLH